ncbi:P1 family peptidase [Pseudonocardia aurantiaca]|uniref:P1 family peptidase n=1 Tax=Pseudonocardia aurantiaca TaxID=75290 RepID=A0ABW4FUV4_9PSEU
MFRGPHNALTDVAGLRVGHATRTGDGALTGVTVVLAPDGGAVGGIDVRGAAPGTRETDLLDPRNTVQRVHALVLTGGSAYGLAAADGVMAWLEERGVGVPVPGWIVPIVPAAVLFDLGRGGDVRARPTAETGAAACAAATDGPVTQGAVGAGTGAQAGGFKGGVGSASAVLPDGSVVAALVVVNAAGSAVDLTTGELHGARLGLPGEFPEVPAPDLDAMRAAAALRPPPALGSATTIGVVATDVTLDKAGCSRLAGVGHDGLARALSPVHTAADGDALFGLSTGARPTPDLTALVELQSVAADVVSRAVVHAMLAAETVTTTAGTWPGYRKLAGLS